MMLKEIDPLVTKQLPEALSDYFESGTPVRKWTMQILLYATQNGVKDNYWFLEESLRMIASGFRAIDYGCSRESLEICAKATDPLAFFDLGMNEYRNGNLEGASGWLESAAKLSQRRFGEWKRKGFYAEPEHLVYQWAEQHLIPALEESRQFDRPTLLTEMEKVDVRARQLKYSGLLSLWAKASSREKLEEEEKQIKQIGEECRQETQPLREQIKQLEKKRDEAIVEAKEPRLKRGRELTSLLERHLVIGIPPNFRWNQEYTEDFCFGFGFFDAVEALKYALENQADPVTFINLCGDTRRDLEYHWDKHLGESWPRDIARDSKEKAFFDEETKKALPDLAKTENEYNLGMDALFRCFVGHAREEEKLLEEGKNHFREARRILEAITTDDPLRRSYFKTLSVFLEFLASENVEVFRDPTKMKFDYEYYSVKLK
jgi:hypothetical protein